MLKHTAVLIFSLFFTLCLAQERVENIAESFTKVKVSSGIIATIHVNADANKIIINGLDKDEVNIRSRRDELRISLPLNSLFSNSDTQVDIFVKSVETIEATSSAKLEIEGIVEQDEISFKAVEMASIQAEIEVEKLNLYLLTNGVITLQGKAQNQNIVIKTGAEYNGEKLKTKVTNVEISYQGTASVYASESCVASVIAGGEVSVFGNPEVLDETTKLGGLIKKVIVNK
ncbi:head GIN domain-containing protein [Psychroflexus planctonicus]|uniref:Putative auto-transporter adhesin head GIN domain-containing protein n=1 Tax=Psychroflexus planctonicus TaxID=1526575 RepID=A0ABQ1SEY2_9FLAO|nr:head GIN domain-containing protein [Psychroflexus planctonicus]GGE34381.1 hypothetical protein GCM10010832_13210 [Psychroflexus planctonicus]